MQGLAPTGRAAQELVLRTHTSPVQIRTMRTRKPPIRIVAPGATFRRDDDATHSPMFHQIEGLYIDEGVSWRTSRPRSWRSPRTSSASASRSASGRRSSPSSSRAPSSTSAARSVAGGGCNLCKHTGFIEIGGCGMVHPEGASSLRHRPERYTGWAFGFGIDRMTMMLHQIPHLRLMFEGDIRFLEQFPC
jgi:phenylalanyl-tRNA synthetase alpha chain